MGRKEFESQRLRAKFEILRKEDTGWVVVEDKDLVYSQLVKSNV